jgi:glucokinase
MINAFFHSGVLCLKDQDVVKMNDVMPVEGGVKVVIGPGTGLGQGFMCKSAFSPDYEVYPCEGGHVEFSVRTKEDFELLEFAKTFV